MVGSEIPFSRELGTARPEPFEREDGSLLHIGEADAGTQVGVGVDGT